jgi:GT2 family glycosyltransferase
MTRLSIVIVTYNSRAHIDRCLASLRDHPASIPTEIVIVDNHSPDGTSAAVRATWPAIPLIDAGMNAGFARGNNIGFRQTRGDVVLFLNPDTEVGAGALDRLLGALSARLDAAAAGPRLVDANGRAELSFGNRLGPVAELRQKILVRGHQNGWRPITRYVERITRRSQDVDWVSGACLLVRRKDAEDAHLFDERYFMYIEDVDFCMALRALGRRIIFAPESEVVHHRGRSGVTAPGPTARAYRASQVAFYEKPRPEWAPILRAYLKLRRIETDKTASREV